MRIPHNLKTSIYAIDYTTMIWFNEIKDICGMIKTLLGQKCFSVLCRIFKLGFASLVKRDCAPKIITYAHREENYYFFVHLLCFVEF